MKTTAPIVGNDFYELANDYQSEGNFVNRSRKDSKNLNDNVDRYKAFEKQNVHASILISCQTKTKLYGYLRVDSKYERIWTKDEKIVFQIIANLYALLLEFKNEEF